jgi:signal transduction histidine kinase
MVEKKLGLHISKQIIEQLNGSINYRSNIAGETIFEFDLPCSLE